MSMRRRRHKSSSPPPWAVSPLLPSCSSSSRTLVAVLALTLVAQATDSTIELKPAARSEKYNYGQVLYLSSLFYEAQRSGRLPPTNRVPWRKDSALKDGSDVGHDLVGGWYDAGDHVKFVFPMSFSVTVLAWGLHEYWDAYQSVKEADRMLDTLRWPLDFIVKAHTAKTQLFYQVGDGFVDHAYWGPPEAMTMDRPAFQINETAPGSDIAGEAAAALAAGSLVFKEKDPVYSAKLLVHARQLLVFADMFRGIGSKDFYTSSSFLDEVCWGAIWLYQASGERAYLQQAEAAYADVAARDGFDNAAFGWNEKRAGIDLLLWQITGRDPYRESFENYMQKWFALPTLPNSGMAFYSEWGSLRFTANTAFLALLAADYGIEADTYRQWAKKQVDFILGDCCGGPNPESGKGRYSYIVGMGDDFPRAPHHRSSSCNGPNDCDCSERPHPHVLYGAMVGGPMQDGSYQDRCPDYIHNEVATDYNAGITGAAAALRHLTLTGQQVHDDEDEGGGH